MKKQLLFVMNNLNCGGAEKSLISLLQTIDYSKYDVDLLLFKHYGLFMKKLPPQVKLLEEPFGYHYYDMSLKAAIVDCVKRRRFKVVYSRVRAGVIFKYEKNRTRCDQRVWKYISNSLAELNKEYDAAIGYLEMAPIYFVAEKVKAKKKIGWIHTNYQNSGMDNQLDYPYFNLMDNIITVSEECQNGLYTQFPNLTNKFKVINNIVSPNTIINLSKQKTSDQSMDDPKIIKIVTVARLCHVKGIDLALDACKLLLDRGYKVKWFVIGTGTEQENDYYQSLVVKSNLQDCFILMGVKDNPYPYIKKADIYVQPSRFEGKSIAIDEAKILQKPIIVTNFTTAKDQINNRENGLIVEMDANSIGKGLMEVIDNRELKDYFQTNLSKERLGNESEVKKLYHLIK